MLWILLLNPKYQDNIIDKKYAIYNTLIQNKLNTKTLNWVTFKK